MIKFLERGTILESIRSLCTDDNSEKCLAVAYWGRGSTDALGLNSDSNVKVVLDIEAGGTNPRELKYLRDRIGAENISVRGGLHAKVYATANAAIIGSANASGNGLSFSYRGNVEASVLVTGETAKAAFDFANEQFAEGELLDDEHIKACRKRFGHQKTAFAEEGDVQRLAVSEALLRQPEYVESLPLICSVYNLSRAELRKHWSEQKEAVAPEDENKTYDEVDDLWDGYSWKLDRKYVGEVCLGIHRGPRGGLTASVFRVSEPGDEFTFVRFAPWNQIPGISNRKSGEVPLTFSDQELRNRFEKKLEELANDYQRYKETWELLDGLV